MVGEGLSPAPSSRRQQTRTTFLRVSSLKAEVTPKNREGSGGPGRVLAAGGKGVGRRLWKAPEVVVQGRGGRGAGQAVHSDVAGRLAKAQFHSFPRGWPSPPPRPEWTSGKFS